GGRRQPSDPPMVQPPVDQPRVEPRRDEPRRGEPRVVEPRSEPRRDEPRRVEPRVVEPRSEPRRDEPRRVEPRNEPRSEPRRAEQTISSEDIRRRIGIIADDSMRGRDTPSPELDKVAQYIAREYRRLGLKPGGENGSFLQRYSIDRVQVVAESSVAFIHGGADVTFSYGTDFVFVDNSFDSGDYAGDLVLLSGPLG